jgi:hypothetical protein
MRTKGTLVGHGVSLDDISSFFRATKTLDFTLNEEIPKT